MLKGKTMALSHRLLMVVFVLAFALAVGEARAQTPKNTLVIGTINMPPHSVEDGSMPSFSRELFKRIMESQGYSVEIRFYPWARAYELGKAGLVDAVWPSIHLKERETWFRFGQPVLNTNYVLIKRRNLPVVYGGLEDAKPYTIGTLRGGITGSPLDGAAPGYHVEPGNTFEQNLLKLDAGRIDFMTSERYNGAYLLNTEFPELNRSVEMQLPPISTIGFYLMFSSNATDVQEKMEAFEKGLSVMRSNGELARLLERYGYEVERALPE